MLGYDILSWRRSKRMLVCRRFTSALSLRLSRKRPNFLPCRSEFAEKAASSCGHTLATVLVSSCLEGRLQVFLCSVRCSYTPQTLTSSNNMNKVVGNKGGSRQALVMSTCILPHLAFPLQRFTNSTRTRSPPSRCLSTRDCPKRN